MISLKRIGNIYKKKQCGQIQNLTKSEDFVFESTFKKLIEYYNELKQQNLKLFLKNQELELKVASLELKLESLGLSPNITFKQCEDLRPYIKNILICLKKENKTF